MSIITVCAVCGDACEPPDEDWEEGDDESLLLCYHCGCVQLAVGYYGPRRREDFPARCINIPDDWIIRSEDD